MGERHVVRGVLAGVAGGLVASWVMNQFMAGPGKTLTEVVLTPQEKAQQQAEAEQKERTGEPDATMKAADAIVNLATGGEHLSYEGKETGGPIVHYAFGAVMGGIYGGLAEYSSVVRSGFGTSFASALFAGADLVAVPALKLSGSSEGEPKAALVTPYAAHLVYGVTTEAVRRLMRKVI
jgi:putative membrane protein